VPAALLSLAAYGLISTPAVIARQLVIQRNTPNAVRGRVSSTFLISRDLLIAAGMALAGLADLVDVRVPFIVASFVVLAAGALTLIVPGLRRPATEWRQTLRMLRGVPCPGSGRPATLEDVERLAEHLPLLASLPRRDRLALAAEMSARTVPAGAAIVRAGDADGSALFILDGGAVTGCQEDGGYRVLQVLRAGDFFGEIAALTGVPHTTDVLAEQATTTLHMPATALRMLIERARLTSPTVGTHAVDRPQAKRRGQPVENRLETIQTRMLEDEALA
jgi:CRP-like cAMP-binding protein